MKIVSGGQTGVDRAALDAAMKHHIECGGWCPAGRLDEFGIIPDVYPLTELPNGGFAERTAANVRDSDGTAIFHNGELGGGTEHTLDCCRQYKRPRVLLDGRIISVQEASRVVEYFVQRVNVNTLNVAGPRQTEWPGGYDFAFAVLDTFLSRANRS